MSNFWIEQVEVTEYEAEYNKMRLREMLQVGKNFLMEYSVSYGKIRLKRVVEIVHQDEDFYYVNTGYLRNIAIYKDDVIDAQEV